MSVFDLPLSAAGGGLLSLSAGADEAAVHRTLLERVFAKRLRDFDVADQLRARLKEMGVEVHDERQLYRFRVQRGPVLATSHGYTRELANDGTDAVLSAEDEAKLDDVILERVNAKRTRDFVTADQLRANLKDSGVTIDDQRLVFRVSVRAAPAPAAPRGPMLATNHGYTREAVGDGSDAVLSTDEQATLDALLLERVNAKRTRDFGRADALRAQMRDAGVTIEDQALRYRVTVRPPAMPAAPRGPILATHHGYTRVTVHDGSIDPTLVDPIVSAEDQAILDRLLTDRLNAKRTRDFATADALRSQLEAAGVTVDDASQTYRIPPPPPPRAPGAPSTDHGYARAAEDAEGWAALGAEACAAKAECQRFTFKLVRIGGRGAAAVGPRVRPGVHAGVAQCVLKAGGAASLRWCVDGARGAAQVTSSRANSPSDPPSVI